MVVYLCMDVSSDNRDQLIGMVAPALEDSVTDRCRNLQEWSLQLIPSLNFAKHLVPTAVETLCTTLTPLAPAIELGRWLLNG